MNYTRLYLKTLRLDRFLVAELAKSSEFRGLSEVLATSATGFETTGFETKPSLSIEIGGIRRPGAQL